MLDVDMSQMRICDWTRTWVPQKCQAVHTSKYEEWGEQSFGAEECAPWLVFWEGGGGRYTIYMALQSGGCGGMNGMRQFQPKIYT